MTTAVGTSSTTTGSVGWSNAHRTVADDNIYAASNSISNGANTGNLILTAWVFQSSIPDTAIINGISISITAKNLNGSNGFSVTQGRLRLAGADIGTNKTSAMWVGTSESTKVIGGATDTWGATGLMGSDLNSTGFGTRFVFKNNGTAGNIFYIDYMPMTVYYTDAAGNNHQQFFWAELG